MERYVHKGMTIPIAEAARGRKVRLDAVAQLGKIPQIKRMQTLLSQVGGKPAEQQVQILRHVIETAEAISIAHQAALSAVIEAADSIGYDSPRIQELKDGYQRLCGPVDPVQRLDQGRPDVRRADEGARQADRGKRADRKPDDSRDG